MLTAGRAGSGGPACGGSGCRTSTPLIFNASSKYDAVQRGATALGASEARRAFNDRPPG